MQICQILVLFHREVTWWDPSDPHQFVPWRHHIQVLTFPPPIQPSWRYSGDWDHDELPTQTMHLFLREIPSNLPFALIDFHPKWVNLMIFEISNNQLVGWDAWAKDDSKKVGSWWFTAKTVSPIKVNILLKKETSTPRKKKEGVNFWTKRPKSWNVQFRLFYRCQNMQFGSNLICKCNFQNLRNQQNLSEHLRIRMEILHQPTQVLLTLRAFYCSPRSVVFHVAIPMTWRARILGG